MAKKSAKALRQTTRRLVGGRRGGGRTTATGRIRPKSGETSGSFIRRMLEDGRFSVDEMVERNLRHFPGLKTSSKSVYYYHYWLSRSGDLTTPWSAYRRERAN